MIQKNNYNILETTIKAGKLCLEALIKTETNITDKKRMTKKTIKILNQENKQEKTIYITEKFFCPVYQKEKSIVQCWIQDKEYARGWSGKIDKTKFNQLMENAKLMIYVIENKGENFWNLILKNKQKKMEWREKFIQFKIDYSVIYVQKNKIKYP